MRRKYFRYKFENPIPAAISIIRVFHKQVSTGLASIDIIDISASGIKFHSDLVFPVTDNILLRVQFRLLNHPFDICGTIVRNEMVSDQINGYGMMFKTNDQKIYLSNIINQLSYKML